MCEENGPSLPVVSFVIIMYTAERITLVILCRVNNCVGEGGLRRRPSEVSLMLSAISLQMPNLTTVITTTWLLSELGPIYLALTLSMSGLITIEATHNWQLGSSTGCK